MTKKIILLSLCASVSIYAQSEVKRLKIQLAQQTKVTQSLQERIEALETQSNPSAATYSQKSFLPDIALILDGSAVSRNINNSTYESYYIPGFSSYNPDEESEIPFNKNRGFTQITK